MMHYKKFIYENVFAIVFIFTILTCTIAILFYMVFSNIIFNPNSQAALKGPISLLFNPSLLTPTNSAGSVNIMARVNNPISIQGYTYTISFDKNVVNISNISFNLGVVCAGLSDSNSNLNIVNTKGSIKICGEIQSSVATTLSSTADNNLTTINFTMLNNNTNTQFTFNTSQQNALYTVSSDNFISQQNVNSFGLFYIKRPGTRG